MANVKISQLPSYTGNTSGSWLVMNNSGETTTYKVQRENVISGLATTSSLTALSSSIAVTDLSQNNRLTSIESVTSSFQPSGNYATTGSNVFRGNQTITGSLSLTSGSLRVSDPLFGTTSISGNTVDTNTGLVLASVFASNGQLNLFSSNDNDIQINAGTGSILLNNNNTKITGSVAVTGSVAIQGSGNTALNVNSGNSLFSGSVIINGSSPSGTKFLFFQNASGSAGAQINYAPSGNGILGISAGVSGSVSIGTTQAGINTLFGDTRLTGSKHAITGSLGIRGNVQMTGSINQTGSLTVSSSLGGVNNTIIANLSSGLNIIAASGNAIEAHSSSFGNAIQAYNGASNLMNVTSTGNNIINVGGTGRNLIYGITQISGSSHAITGSLNVTGSASISGSVNITGSSTLNAGGGNNVLTGSLNTMDSFGVGNYMVARGGSNFLSAAINQLSGSTFNRIIGSTSITGSLNVTGSASITGSLSVIGLNVVSLSSLGSIIQTGSVQGNISPLTITSNTASLNLNNGNFFTLQLVSGSSTHLNPSNIKPGQTVSVFVNTTGSATMTFPSSIKQISGSSYVPTTTTGLDILTLVSADTSSLYLVNAKNFI